MRDLIGAVEAGGTKFVCGVGSSPDALEVVRLPTEKPEITLAKVVDFFSPFQDRLKAIGVGSFGPLDVNPISPQYGYITSTPKPYWGNTDLLGNLKSHFSVPFGFDTDVNAAALAENKLGAAKGLSDLVYITIGTGVGGGIMTNGQLLHGLVHPELGHMAVAKHPDDSFTGHCLFHGDKCLEGLCCGPAIEARWGAPGHQLPGDHPAWELQSFYLGQALASLVCILSPQKIILGGGVMARDGLLEKIRVKTQQALNGYVQHNALIENIEDYIVAPGLGDRAGLVGSFLLGEAASLAAI